MIWLVKNKIRLLGYVDESKWENKDGVVYSSSYFSFSQIQGLSPCLLSKQRPENVTWSFNKQKTHTIYKFS